MRVLQTVQRRGKCPSSWSSCSAPSQEARCGPLGCDSARQRPTFSEETAEAWRGRGGGLRGKHVRSCLRLVPAKQIVSTSRIRKNGKKGLSSLANTCCNPARGPAGNTAHFEDPKVSVLCCPLPEGSMCGAVANHRGPHPGSGYRGSLGMLSSLCLQPPPSHSSLLPRGGGGPPYLSPPPLPLHLLSS